MKMFVFLVCMQYLYNDIAQESHSLGVVMDAHQTPAVILLDIEGTTTSISFVKDVLFPYARKHAECFLDTNWGNPEVQEIVKELRNQVEKDVQSGINALPILGSGTEDAEQIKSVLANVYWQMDSDRKTTGLKSLQGKIWKHGYDVGELKGHVYEDVPDAMKTWTDSGKKVYIYSSGSILAQKLIFGHTIAGDLTPFLSGYFDTTSGAKTEASSYVTIASKIGTDPKNILFLTDIPKEAYAAKEAGFEVIVMIRPGNTPLSSTEAEDFNTAETFSSLCSTKL